MPWPPGAITGGALRRNSPELERLQAQAPERTRFGYRELHILLERDGLAVNHKRVHRIYQAAGLQVRRPDGSG